MAAETVGFTGLPNSDRYEPLRQAYTALFHLALIRIRKQADILGERIASKQILDPAEVHVNETESSFGVRVWAHPHMVTDWRWVTLRLTTGLLEDTLECQAARAALAQFVEVDKYSGIEQSFFFDPLADLVAAEKRFDISKEALAKKIDELIRHIETDSYVIEATGVLSGFWSEIPEISFETSWIKNLDIQDMRRYWAALPEASPGSDGPTTADFLIQTTCSAKGANNGNEYHLAFKKLEQTLFVLRLFKRGAISIKSTAARHLTWAPIAEPGGQLKRSFEIRKYRLAQSEAAGLLDCWKKYAPLFESDDPRVKLAVDRFGSSYSRLTPQDAIIDIFIALEGLLIENAQELSYKLRMRMANLLGGSRQDRINTFEDIKAGYELRSKIVHGNHPAKLVRVSSSQQKVDLSQFAEEMTRYLARALMSVADIHREFPKDDVIGRLDAMAIGGA